MTKWKIVPVEPRMAMDFKAALEGQGRCKGGAGLAALENANEYN